MASTALGRVQPFGSRTLQAWLQRGNRGIGFDGGEQQAALDPGNARPKRRPKSAAQQEHATDAVSKAVAGGTLHVGDGGAGTGGTLSTAEQRKRARASAKRVADLVDQELAGERGVPGSVAKIATWECGPGAWLGFCQQ